LFSFIGGKIGYTLYVYGCRTNSHHKTSQQPRASAYMYMPWPGKNLVLFLTNFSKFKGIFRPVFLAHVIVIVLLHVKTYKICLRNALVVIDNATITQPIDSN